MTALTCFDFEEVPVRVVMIGDAPWFVATDVAKVLEYRNAPDLTRMLDDDERGTHIVRTDGYIDQDMSIISESGLYHAIFKSRKAKAERFRKWVTGEVLPALRRHGHYTLHQLDQASDLSGAMDYDGPQLSARVAVVREARRLFGTKAARAVWAELGLPLAVAGAMPTAEADPMVEQLREWLDGRDSVTVAECVAGLGLNAFDISIRRRVGAALRLLGYASRPVRHNGAVVKLYSRGGVS